MNASNSSESASKIAHLHQTFCTIVPESQCTFNMAREHDWWNWLKWRPEQPFAPTDLARVVSYRRKLITAKSQFPACLKFSYLIGRPDLFEEDLSMALAAPKPKSDRDKVLEASGRIPEPTKPPKEAGALAKSVLNRSQFLASMRQLRESLEP